MTPGYGKELLDLLIGSELAPEVVQVIMKGDHLADLLFYAYANGRVPQLIEIFQRAVDRAPSPSSSVQVDPEALG